MKRLSLSILCSFFTMFAFSGSAFADDDDIVCRAAISYQGKIQLAVEDGHTLQEAQYDAIDKACIYACRSTRGPERKACKIDCLANASVQDLYCEDSKGNALIAEGGCLGQCLSKQDSGKHPIQFIPETRSQKSKDERLENAEKLKNNGKKGYRNPKKKVTDQNIKEL